MIELLIDPVAKPRMTRSDSWKKRPCVVKYYSFKDKLLLLAKKLKFKLTDEYKVEFIIAMPDSWSKHKRSIMVGTPHKSRPDLDNLLKALNDCLMVEDSGIWHIEASKVWGEEGKIIIY